MPNISRGVSSNTSLAIVSVGSKLVARAGAFIVIAPLIGPTNQGTIVVCAGWAGLISMIVIYGFPVRALRLISANPDGAAIIAISDLRAMSAMLAPAALTAFLVAALALEEPSYLIFFLVFVAACLSAVGDYLSAVLRGLDRFAVEAKISAVTSALHIVLMVAAAVLSERLIWIAGAMVLSRLIFAAASIAAVFSQRFSALHEKDEGDYAPVLGTLKGSSPYAVDGALSVALGQLDVLILDQLLTRDEVGTYAAASRLVQLVIILPSIMVQVYVPQLTRSLGSAGSADELRKLSTVIAGIALAAAAGFFLLGPLYQSIILGPAYVAANLLWPSLAVLVLARMFEAYFGILLIVLGKQWERVRSQAVLLLAILLTGFWLVPVFGSRGIIVAVSLGFVGLGLRYSLVVSNETSMSGFAFKKHSIFGLGLASLALAVLLA